MATKPNSTALAVIELLQICRDIEACCAKIYQVYASGFVRDQELCALWCKTQAEEENHARQFDLAINLRQEGVVVAMQLDKERAVQILNMVKTIHDQAVERLPSKLDCLRSAIMIERELADFHVDAVAEFQVAGMKALFHAMLQADNQHLQAIEQLYESRLRARQMSAAG